MCLRPLIVALLVTLVSAGCMRLAPSNPKPVSPTTEPSNHDQVQGQRISSATFIDENVGWMVLDDRQLMATTDSGKTWDLRTTADAPVTHLHFVSREEGWMSTIEGLYQTDDGGRTWRRVETGRHPVEFVGFVDPRRGWITSSGQLLVTKDGGATWNLLDDPCDSSGMYANYASFVGADVGWTICTKSGGSGLMEKRVYHTANGGMRWSLLAEATVRWDDGIPRGHDSPGGLPSGDYVGSFFFLDDQHGWLTGTRYGTVWATSDGGVTWTRLNSVSDQPSGDLHDLRFLSPTFGHMVASIGRNSVLLETRDGGDSWTPLYTTLQSGLK